MNKIALIFVTAAVVLAQQAAFACLPQAGTSVSGIRINNQIVGTMVNTLNEGLVTGSLLIKLEGTAEVLSAKLERNVGGAVKVLEKASYDGQELKLSVPMRGGDRLTLNINGIILKFEKRLTRGCGGAVSQTN
ncbi:MAG: hypothetical protein IPM97_05150 [Bdellovibrionaceae bacterium]|nr:hypothetical protein [Pseudobdellovibrionaceae bacterium]